MRKCEEPGCDRKHQAKGYCQKHYQYHKEWGNLDLPKCSVDSCDRGMVKKSYCKKHYDIQYKYGITPEHYESMLNMQNGICAICKTYSSDSLVVDHHHNNNYVRALLCRNCNAGIGLLKEDIHILKNAIEYLNNN